MAEAVRYTAWPVDRFFPPTLQRLQRALEELYLASQPPTSGSVTSVGGPRPDSHEPPGVVFSAEQANGTGGRLVADRYRWLLDRYLKRVARLVAELDSDVRGGLLERGPRRGWRCSGCGCHQRDRARFCDRCGGERHPSQTTG